MKKVDIHVHCSKNNKNKINGVPLITADQLLRVMDKNGIDKSVLMSMSQIDRYLMSNKESFDITNMTDRLYYMANIDPDKDVYNTLLKEKKNGAIGVGELVYNEAFTSEKIRKILSVAEYLSMPVLFHISPSIGNYYGVYDKKNLPFLESVLKSYPNLIFIGHSQAFWCEISDYEEDDAVYRNSYPEGPVIEGRVPKLMRKYNNLYADLSANSGSNAIMRDKKYGIKFLNEFSDRLFFGTDTYNKDQEFPIESI